MNKLIMLYRSLNTLSLDVTAGAVASAAFFGEVFQVKISAAVLACLGLAVWIIYTIDHLMDARRVAAPASTYRHYFHQVNYQKIVWALALAILAEFVLTLSMQKPVLQWGGLLALAVAFYLLIQRYLAYTKEVFGAILYCTGVLIPAFSLSAGPVDWRGGLLILQFGLVVLTNLMLFSLFDVQRDLQDNQHSFATTGGRASASRTLWVLFLLSAVLMALQGYFGQSPVRALIIFLMNGVLLMIFLFPGKFEVDERYRLPADAVFFVPALILV